MFTEKFLPLIVVIALLQQLTTVQPFLTRSSSHCSSSHKVSRLLARDLAPLRAAAEDDNDDLSSNFLNFLKKNKDEGDDDEEEEEEEEEEVVTGDGEEKIKPNLFKEIISGAFELHYPSYILVH